MLARDVILHIWKQRSYEQRRRKKCLFLQLVVASYQSLRFLWLSHACRALVSSANGRKLQARTCGCLFLGITFSQVASFSPDVLKQSAPFPGDLKRLQGVYLRLMGGLGGRMDEVCLQTGVTHDVCVFSCWAQGWMGIMAFSTTASSRLSGG